MAQFWKPGSERPTSRLLEDEGGVLYLPHSTPSSSHSGFGYASLVKQRKRLPVYKYRTAILYLVENHATTVIVGETGSGKTTQIPQVVVLHVASPAYLDKRYLKEAGWAADGRVIACTQRRRLAVQGDHVTFLNIYQGFIRSGKSAQWCYKNFINYNSMKKVIDIREKLIRLVKRLGLVIQSCEKDTEVVRRAITSGFFAHACCLETYGQEGVYKTIRGSQEVYIHPSSVLFRVNPKCVIYHEIVSIEKSTCEMLFQFILLGLQNLLHTFINYRN